MIELVELTLEDGSSVWLERSTIVSFSQIMNGTRLTVLENGGAEKQIDVSDSFASVSDLMDPVEPPDPPGDFME